MTSTADCEIVTERLINAPRELVFAAWTDPEQMVKWWGPDGFTNTMHEMDVRPGGLWRFVMHGPDGTDYQNRSVFVEVVAPSLIVYDHVSTPKFRNSVTFVEEGAKTRLTMRAVFEDANAYEMAVKTFGAVEGGKQTLGRLAAFVEGGGVPGRRRIILFMHATLDGFVAGPKGEMDCFHVDDEIFDYAGARTNEGDTALYGRVTYEMMEAYWPTAADQPNPSKHDIEHSSWYNRVNKVVLSRSMKGVSRPRTRFIGDNLVAEINALKATQGKDILIFGSPGAAHSLMAEDLIDGYWIFVNPLLLGKGVRLFDDVPALQRLRLLESKALSSGVVCLHYERKRDLQGLPDAAGVGADHR